MNTVEENTWEKPYQIIVRRAKLAVTITPKGEAVTNIVEHLFPKRKRFELGAPTEIEAPTLFTAKEISRTRAKLKTRRPRS